MNMSEKNRTALYNAICEPIITLKIDLNKYGPPSYEDLDQRLLKIQNEIWRNVHKVLKIKGPV